ncbi:MAG: TonB-dependent siderophore receptor, partial [Cyanobacteria bacterium J06626_18]
QSLSARHTTPLRANSPTLSLPPIPFGKASPTTPLGSGNNYPAIHYPLPTTHHLTSLSNAIAQTETSPIEIIGIQLEETETGLQVMLETADGELTPSTPSVSGNALITEIPNAVLVQEEFLEFEPAEGIALVQVTELPGNRVQVVVTGLETAPTVESSTTATKLTLSILPGTPQVGEAADPLRVVVTGEQEDGSRYFEPTATTGTRTDTPLRDIPQSIQVIPREVLEDQQVIRLDEALRNVSGVTFGSTDAGRGLQFNIRGFNSAPILRNGFRQIGPRQASSRRSFPEVANLEQVEVLKGPAAVLYGEVEPGGVINLVTKRPLSEPYYQFQTQIGSRELLRPSIDLSGPLTDDGRLLYRLNAVYQSRDEIQNYDSDIRRSFISPVLTWQISDRTDLTIELEYLEDERPAFYGLPAFGDGIADIPPDQISNEPDDVMKQEFFNIGYDFEHRFSDNWRIRNGFRYVREDSALEAAVPIDLDEETGLLLRNFSLQDAETEVFALQTNIVGEFTTGSIEHTLLFGIDLDRTHLRGSTTVDVFNPLLLDIFDPVYEAVPRPSNFEELPLLLDENTRTDQLGIYIQDQISLLDNLILLAGLRYDTVEQRRTGRPTLFNPDGTDEIQNDDAFSPRIGIVYQPIEEISLYANYSRSFTPNTGTSFEGDLFEPEEGEGYEVGIKAELLDGRLAATLSYFDITKQNVVTADPEIIGASVITGEQRSRGVELDIIGEILPGWNVIASYAFIDAEIIEDNTFEVGNRLIGVPEHSASLWTTYEIQSGDLQGLGLGLGFDFVGDREGDLENSFQLDSYFVTNAAIFYGRDNWRAALNFRNLFDTDYMVGGINNRFRSNEPGEPFTVVGSISVQF